jgi:hypothetical protein
MDLGLGLLVTVGTCSSMVEKPVGLQGFCHDHEISAITAEHKERSCSA